ncbi:MAG: 3-methyl-2-oxobutanoate hydroxymethyltransferase [Planctomycetota bacterium]
MKTHTTHTLTRAKGRETLVAVTASDALTARLAQEAGVDIILVGDSLGMVFQGRSDTLGVTMDQMVYHSQCVSRGAPSTFRVGDMPFMTFQVNAQETVRHAGRLLAEGSVHAVKIEGAGKRCEGIKACVEEGIPVMGHVGLTPQSVHALGGFRVQRDAARILEDALAVQEAGAFSVVLEGMPSDIAQTITRDLRIPTIGIGAGPSCDGQILVWHDLLGLTQEPRPRFVKVFSNLGSAALKGLKTYAKEVRNGSYPSTRHSYPSSKGVKE